MDIIGPIQSAIKARKNLINVYLFVSIAGVLLVISRQFLDTDKTFLFLLWNFFLAGLPLIISSIMVQMSLSSGSRNSILALGLIWLLFLPNAPYMLTDYIHVIYGDRKYILLDAFTLSWFAVSAFISAVISLKDISGLLLERFYQWQVTMMVLVICLMCSFGIYLGRDLRFNSWDVIMKPQALVSETVVRLINPSADFYTWISAMTIGLLLFFVHLVTKEKR